MSWSVKKVDRIIEQIKDDRRSGAAELIQMAASALGGLAESVHTKHTEYFLKLFSIRAAQLMSAQPSMAPILNLVYGIQSRIKDLNDIGDIKKEIDAALREARDRRTHSTKRVARHVFGLIHNDCKIVTYSFSSTVLEALRCAKRKGKKFEVLCSESRPRGEGMVLAERLAQAGIETTLVIDARLFDLVPKADMIMVGADAVGMDGLINKVGTYGLSVVAKENATPFYSVCTEDKFLTREVSRFFRIAEKNPKEIYKKQIKNLSVRNDYFGSTPLKYISAVITENGVLRLPAIKNKLKGRQV